MSWTDHPRLLQCVDALAAGEVLAYPTEAVWGLGCDPDNKRAIQKILLLKRRSPHKGLILVGSREAHFAFLLERLSSERQKMVQESWPGYTTWLVPHFGHVSPLLCGLHDTIALRVSDHPFVHALCEKYGGPIVSTSANPQGLAPARHMLKARCYFGANVIYAPHAPATASQPSLIKDLTGRILREGGKK